MGKVRLKNLLSLARIIFNEIKLLFFFILFVFFQLSLFSQINHVGNPSFEDTVSTTFPNCISKVKYWTTIDSSWLCGGGKVISTYYGNVPYSSNSWQYPRTGNAYLMTTQFCMSPCVSPNIVQYPKNRLKIPLVNGKVYCAKMYVNINNSAPYGNDAFGIYFGDSSIDTIKYCSVHLTYLTPQVKNTTGNVITDTLNWIEVSGTFTATGTEKYMVLGNFEADANVNKTFINGTYPGVWTDMSYDDVSVIDFNLAANAGPDKNITLGDSAFIGIPPEVGLECVWASGTTTIGTGGGLWVKPTSVGTFSYVVTQNICGNIKKDTVNVNVSPGSVSENEIFAQSISFYPQPAQEYLSVYFHSYYDANINCLIQDINGKEVLRRELPVNQFKAQLDLSGLDNGVYFLHFKTPNDRIAIKRLVIAGN